VKPTDQPVNATVSAFRGAIWCNNIEGNYEAPQPTRHHNININLSAADQFRYLFNWEITTMNKSLSEYVRNATGWQTSFIVGLDQAGTALASKPSQVYEAYDQMPTSSWRFREAARIQTGIYKALPEALIIRMRDELSADQVELALSLHYAHSSSCGKLVAFTSSPEKGGRDIQTTMKLGRYLRGPLGIRDPHKIKAIAEVYNMVNKGNGEGHRVFITNNVNTIASIYDSGVPSSCMGKSADNFQSNPVHPCAAYHPDDWSLAYTTSDDDPDGECTARSMVTQNGKWYGLYYDNHHDADVLRETLTNMGYRQDSTIGYGMRLRRLPFRATFIAPYIDGDADNLYDDGESLWIGDESKGVLCGGAQAAYDTGGLARHDNSCQCVVCKEWNEEDNLSIYSGTGDKIACRRCYDEACVTCSIDGIVMIEADSVFSSREQTWLFNGHPNLITSSKGELIHHSKAVKTYDNKIEHFNDCATTSGGVSALVDDVTVVNGVTYLKEWIKDGIVQGQVFGKYDLANIPVTQLKVMFFKTGLRPSLNNPLRHSLIGLGFRRYNDNWLSYDQLFMNNPAPESLVQASAGLAANASYITLHGPDMFTKSFRFDRKPSTNVAVLVSEHFERELTL